MSFSFTWYGHACHSLEVDGSVVLIDPFLSECPTAAANPSTVEADYILISHGHGDHIGDSVSIAKRTKAKVISNFEISTWFQNQGIEAHGQHVGGGFNHPFGYLKLTQALHGSALPDGSNGGNPVGFLLTTAEGKRIYLACDTGLFGDMRLIGEGGIDLAVLPIGDNFTMGPDDALKAVKLLQPKHVIPVHYDTFELIAQDADAWADRVKAETSAVPHVLNPGDTFTLD